MCKIFAVAGIKPGHEKTVKKLTEAAATELSDTEKDGVGYAAITKSGRIYGEKWANKDDAFKRHTEPKTNVSAEFLNDLAADALKETIPVNKLPMYQSFGNIKNKSDTVALILHARKKTTGEKCAADTHPFFMINDPEKKIDDTALVHNGTILNHEKLTKKFSTCDSEVLLHEYLKHDLNYNPYGIQALADAVRGEYTVGVLSSYEDGNGVQPILDIFKSNKDLVVGYCPEIETALFCTTKWSLEAICKRVGVEIEHITDLKDGMLLKLDAITGKRLEDPIKFKESPRYDNTGVTSPVPWNRSLPGEKVGGTTKTNVINMPSSVTPSTNEKEIEAIKREFEMQNISIFASEYYGEGLSLTEDELALIELATDTDSEYRAVDLVRRVMGYANA